MGSRRAEPPVRILTAGHFGGLATIDVRGLYPKRASHWGCCCGGPPRGIDNDVTVPRYPNLSSLYAVVDFAYPGLDLKEPRQILLSRQSLPPVQRHRRIPPGQPWANGAVSFVRHSWTRDVRRGSIIHVRGGEHSLKSRMQPAVRESSPKAPCRNFSGVKSSSIASHLAVHFISSSCAATDPQPLSLVYLRPLTVGSYL